MWRRAALSSKWSIRRLSTATRRRIEDEGDWFYSSEWWDSASKGHSVLRSTSDKGNGVVSVLAYPSSRPEGVYWPETEKWLQQRYEETQRSEPQERLRVLGYQWRVLRFNDNTRQSTVKVMAFYPDSEPGSVYFMQQPYCLAVPYVKSMVSVGLTSIVSCNYDLVASAVQGQKKLRILCIGHGGGSLALFLASKIKGAFIEIVEIDPLVISTSIQAMGFPAFSVMNKSGKRAFPRPDIIDEVLWGGIHERLFLYESDAEKFILNNKSIYDMIFVDAYDGDDIFPRKLWDPDSPFLKALSDQLHPEHGTVVVNLHSDSELLNPDGSTPSIIQQILPVGKHVSAVARVYKDILVGNGSSSECKGSGLGFTVSVPWVCNTSLVVCRGVGIIEKSLKREVILNALESKSLEVERLLNLPFSCLSYMKRGFNLID